MVFSGDMTIEMKCVRVCSFTHTHTHTMLLFHGFPWNMNCLGGYIQTYIKPTLLRSLLLAAASFFFFLFFNRQTTMTTFSFVLMLISALVSWEFPGLGSGEVGSVALWCIVAVWYTTIPLISLSPGILNHQTKVWDLSNPLTSLRIRPCKCSCLLNSQLSRSLPRDCDSVGLRWSHRYFLLLTVSQGILIFGEVWETRCSVESFQLEHSLKCYFDSIDDINIISQLYSAFPHWQQND